MAAYPTAHVAGAFPSTWWASLARVPLLEGAAGFWAGEEALLAPWQSQGTWQIGGLTGEGLLRSGC